MNPYGFENLQVWQRSSDLIEKVYTLCSRLPKDEKSILVDQVKRSSTSIALNIAEGSVGNNQKVFLQFLNIAHRSLYETVAILKLIERLYKIQITSELENCEEVSKMLSGLKRSLMTNS